MSPSLRVRKGWGTDSHGRGTTTSPMGIRYPIPIPTVIRGVVWRGEVPPSRRSRAGKEEVPPPMTRSNLDRWEAAGKAERGAILDRIAAQCDGLASRIRAGVAGIRLKVEELRSRISRPLEYLMRRKQPRQQSLNDVLRDAQRAADAWNRDHAAPQRTYRGRAR